MSVFRNHVKPFGFHSYTVSIDGSDVSNLISAFDVFQDIFSPTWTANLVIIDSINIQINQNVNVGSKVNIKIETDGRKPCDGVQGKSFNFVIHSISDKILFKKETYGYNVKLVNEAQITDFKKRVSKSFKKKKAEQIVKNVIQEEMNGSVESDSKEGTYDIIIPNLSPISTVNFVSKFAKKQNKEADFIFFQTDENKYKFKSFDSMFTDGIGGDFKLIHKEANYNITSGEENEDSFQKIQKYAFVSQLDGLRNMASGFFGSKTITHDIINKKIVEEEYKYGQFSPSDKSGKPYTGSVFNDAGNSVISYMTVHEDMTSSKSFHDDSKNWEGSRRSSVLKLDTNRLVVEIPGGICWWQTLGKMIQVELPAQESNDDLDKYYTGQYVVMAIKHTISGNAYAITMELGKKRLNQSI